MSRYNVGDKVKVREDLDIEKRYDGLGVNSDMMELVGEVVTVSRVYCDGDFSVEESKWYWNDDMVVALEPQYKVGDKVRVRADLKEDEYGNSCATSDMVELAGQIVTISLVDPEDNTYHIEELGYWWSGEMFVGKVEEVGEDDEEPSIKVVAKESYQVGDKVKVRSDLKIDEDYGTDSFVEGMEKVLGKVVTIEHVCSDGEYYIEELGYYWTNEMFEGKVVEDDEIEEIEEESTSKFKVGDEVRVRTDLEADECYGDEDLYFAYGMEQYRGEVTTVVAVEIDSYGVAHYVLEIDEDREYVFNDAMLESKEDIKEEVKAIIKEPKTFKKGDVVRVKKGLEEYEEYNGCYCNGDMERMSERQDIFTITGIKRNGRYEVVENTWEWDMSMLEFVSSEKYVTLTDICFKRNGIFRSAVCDTYIIIQDGKMVVAGSAEISTNSKLVGVDYSIKSLKDMVGEDGEIKDRKVKIISDIIQNDEDLTPSQREYFNGFQNLKNILEQITNIYEVTTSVKILLKSNFYAIED